MEDKPERSEKDNIVKDFCEPLNDEKKEKCIDYYDDLGGKEKKTNLEDE